MVENSAYSDFMVKKAKTTQKSTTSFQTPLMFLHGWGTTSNIWQSQVAFFTPKWPVMAPDFLHTAPHLPFFSTPRTVETIVEGLSSLCHAYHLPPIHLVGWSLGSMMALEFSSRFPALVASLTLVGGTPKFLADESFPWGLPKGELRLLRKRFQQNRVAALTTFYQLLFTDREKNREVLLRARNRLRSNRNISDQALLEGLAILESTDLRPVLPHLSMPVLIIHGEEDKICPIEAGLFMHQHIPRSRLDTFPSCGHAPFLTREERFNRTVEDFLQSSGRP
ncbi:MAG: alpha/beta fold hydrolase [bacterium]